MIGLEAILCWAAYASAIIASLQAGSRARYLLEHNKIGVKEGPLILPPKSENDTSPLWDLVQVFQESVRLGLLHHHYLNLDGDGETKHGLFIVEHSSQHIGSKKHNNNEQLLPHDYQLKEPYSLSPFPKPSSSKTTGGAEEEEAETLDQLVEMYMEQQQQGIQPEEEEAHPILEGFKRFGSKFWPSTSISKLKLTTNYWMKRTYYWRKSIEEFEEEFIDEADDEMDFSLCISKKIRLMGANGNTTQQVAQIIAHAPECFARLRSHFKISDASFRRSIFEAGPYISFQSNSKGAARAGGVFFFTRDGAYMIKTIKTGEAQTLVRMLPKYYKHMKRYRRHSLLTRFCGMYTVNIRDATSRAGLSNEEQYTFVIMNSVFPAEASGFISEMYDLKGSTVGRECSPEEKRKKGPNAVLKDLDLAREVELVRSLQNDNDAGETPGTYGISLGASAKSELLAQLRKDVALLRECYVMDYSLLVGIVNMDPPQIDAADVNALELSINQERRFGVTKADHRLLLALTTPIRLMIAPPLFFTRKWWSLIERIMTSVLTYPLPYYGSSVCGVDGGALSVMHGTRSGRRAIYYLGLIDFLQPWTVRKVAEKQLKGFLGYDTSAISCVDPDEYSSRFLEFIEAHVS